MKILLKFNNPIAYNRRIVGFTLVELLVVISIISLLSAVVLATLTSARATAKTTAFRAEMNQVISALELYRNDNGKYPGEKYLSSPYVETTFEYGSYYNNWIYLAPNAFDLASELSKYIKKMPTPTTIKNNYDYYYSYKQDKNFPYRCLGDVNTPSYVILVNTMMNPPEGFNDWKGYQTYTAGVWSTISDNSKCFSLK